MQPGLTAARERLTAQRQGSEQRDRTEEAPPERDLKRLERPMLAKTRTTDIESLPSSLLTTGSGIVFRAETNRCGSLLFPRS